MLNRLLAIVFILNLFGSVAELYAQLPYKPEVQDPLLEPWRWKFLPELRGKGVRCIESATNGDVWFGTDRGACRYDGMDWSFFDTTNSDIVFPVNSLVANADGTVFAGSDKGIAVHRDGRWQMLFPREKNDLLKIGCLKGLKNGEVLAGISRGLIYIGRGRIVFFTPQQGQETLRRSFPDSEFVTLPDDYMFGPSTPRVDDFFENSEEELWVFTSQSAQGKIFKFNLRESLAHKKVEGVEVVTRLAGKNLYRGLKAIRASDGKVWIISSYHRSGVYTFDGVRWTFLQLSRLLGGDELHTCIKESKDGSILVGGIGKMFVYKNGRWKLYEAPEFPIPYSRVILNESSNGNLWIAGLQNDAYRFDYGSNKWLTYNNLNFECETPDHRKWFLSVDGRVVVNDRDHWCCFNATDSLIDAPVRMISTRNGMVWAAGSHKGIAAAAYYDGRQWHRQTYPQLSWGVDYRAVFEASDGSIWLGASVDAIEQKGHLAGVICLKPTTTGAFQLIHYKDEHGVSQDNAYGIGQSRDGAIWMGGTQLLRFDGSRWCDRGKPEALNHFVNYVFSRPGQNLWVGSRFYGLFAYNGREWSHYNADSGLPGNSIISIFSQNDSTVWVATDNDICRFDGRTWTTEIFHPQLLLTREGGEVVQSDDGSVWINKSLREWKRRAFTFNSAPRMAYENFRTIRYNPDSMAPQTNIQVYTKEVDQAGNTVISWMGKDYYEDTPASKLQYSYRLNGGEWSAFSRQNYATLTKLRDGLYDFEVRARDLDFNVESTPARISFRVLPAVWKRTWFILLIATFVCAIAYYEVQSYRRNQKLNRLNISLSEINRELTRQKEEIIAKNEEIVSHQEHILFQKNQLEKSNELLEKQNLEIKLQRDKLEEMVQRIEELSQAKLRFFTNISHEFRTPLTLILGPIDRLLSAKVSDEIERLNLYGVIYRSANRLLRLINQILEFRKLENGRVDFNPQNGDIIAFVRDTTSLFSGIAHQRHIDLSFISQPKELLTAFDHDKVENIVFNLLSNAFKFTPECGSITVEILENRIPDGLNGGGERAFVQINVVDSGTGIAAEHLERIFERFYQVNEKSHPSGTGIGLAYIKDLVEIHGGKITVVSNLGQGSCFMVLLPVLAEGSTSVDRLPDSIVASMPVSDCFRQLADQGGQKREMRPCSRNRLKPLSDHDSGMTPHDKVLIVEDDLELMSYLKSNLTQFHCIVAHNGKEGLEKANELQPDLVISDIMMPEMDGVELCRYLKTGLLTSHIPVILLTARTLLESKIEGFESGADDYIEKPFNLQLLQVRARALIESRKRLRELFRKEVIIEPSKVTVTSSDEKLLKGVMELIERNIAEPGFNIEDLCKNFYLSRSHFSRKIKQLTSFSPKELLDRYRLKRAAQLIRDNNITIAEVSYMVGFEHPNSLSRAFRKQFGVSPTEYQNQKLYSA
jgi:signal transduction histidine kinase/CheY-like chemotaxis protein/AraC-like DNA-binding protein/ligand-binding sensor domain-containing protein